MILSMSNIAWAPEERLGAYASMVGAGLAGVEIAPGLFFHASKDPFVPSDTEAREALAEIADHGLALVSMQSLLFGVEGAALFDGEAGRAALVQGINRAIDLAGRLGIPNLVFGSPAQRRVPDGVAMEQALAEAAEVFRELGDRAAQAGTKITIEANPAAYGTNFLNTLDEALSFVEAVDHPAIAAILDLGAMHMNGDFDSLSEALPALAPKLNHVHVSEPDLAPAPADPNRLAPVLSGLAQQGYKKAVSIEMRRPQSGLEGVRSSIAELANAARLGENVHA